MDKINLASEILTLLKKLFSFIQTSQKKKTKRIIVIARSWNKVVGKRDKVVIKELEKSKNKELIGLGVSNRIVKILQKQQADFNFQYEINNLDSILKYGNISEKGLAITISKNKIRFKNFELGFALLLISLSVLIAIGNKIILLNLFDGQEGIQRLFDVAGLFIFGIFILFKNNNYLRA